MIEYRLAKLDDCGNLAALSMQVWLDTYAIKGVRISFSDYLYKCFTPQDFAKKIDDARYTIIIATQEEYLLGYIMLDAKSFHKAPENGFEISRLYVSRHFQGQSIGKNLLAQMRDICGTCCWLAAFDGNHDAIEFYQHLGFKQIDIAIFNLNDEAVKNRILAIK